ncbi:MAG: hypothetical protein ABGW78_11780 [Pirellulales bacterium]
MVKNPSLRVFQASGYFDLATPHFAADYVVDHMQLPEAFRDHIETEYYPAGHMMYLNLPDLQKLGEDVAKFLSTSNR